MSVFEITSQLHSFYFSFFSFVLLLLLFITCNNVSDKIIKLSKEGERKRREFANENEKFFMLMITASSITFHLLIYLFSNNTLLYSEIKF